MGRVSVRFSIRVKLMVQVRSGLWLRLLLALLSVGTSGTLFTFDSRIRICALYPWPKLSLGRVDCSFAYALANNITVNLSPQ